jgi:carbon-monoxide dehydrogenase medium subunit
MDVEIELAESLEHALELLSAGEWDTRPVAGATDVMLRLQAGKLQARRLVSIYGIQELSYLKGGADGLRFGAGTPITDLMRDPGFAREFRCATQAAREFASPQIRNRATVGGNIGNASPAADMVPPLIALGAEVTLRSHKAQRTLPLDDVFLGFGKTTLQPDELVTDVFIPRRGDWFQAFAKFGSRSANVIAVINMAMCLRLTDHRIEEARVAYGSVAPKPLRARRVEKFLTGQSLSEELVEALVEVVLSEISPIDDVRGSKKYKQRLAVNCTQDALRQAMARAEA